MLCQTFAGESRSVLLPVVGRPRRVSRLSGGTNWAGSTGKRLSLPTFAAAQILRALPRARISRAVGRLCERPLPRRLSAPILDLYCRTYGVNLSEAELPSGGYASFDDFFTRSLLPGVRTVSADGLVSPADGVLSAAGPIESGAQLLVKQQRYSVAELTGDAQDTARYSGGTFAVIYLAPGDYHRVHSPVDGTIDRVRGMSGASFPVNAIGERHIPKLFVRNSRVAIAIDTRTLGRVTTVLVGAMIVGRITVRGVDAPDVPEGVHAIQCPVAKGAEMGAFHLGSTVVVLSEPEAAIERSPGRVRYGESLLRST